MRVNVVILVLVAYIAVSTVTSLDHRDEYIVEKWYTRMANELIDVISLPQIPERYLTGQERFRQNMTKTPSVLQFSWSNCGQANDPIQIKTLSIGPDPIKIPGTLLVSFDGTTSINVTEPFEVDLTIKKKVAFFWVEVPCLEQLGSCNYADFCPLLTQFLNPCPAAFVKANIPCSCPLAQGHYQINEGAIPISNIPIPSWLSSGDYKIQFKASQKSIGKLTCLSLALTLD